MRPARHDDFRLPDLRFVPVEAVVPHEQHDVQRMEPLVEKLREQRVLKNPPVVTPLDEHGAAPRYMVLDGANRCTAAKAAGFPHLLVQIARYEEPWVHLGTWHHALSEARPAEFEAACRAVPGLECRRTAALHARAQLARREALAFAMHGPNEALSFHGGGTLEERNALLLGIVETYRLTRRFYRMSTEAYETMAVRHPDATVLVVFPHFEPAEVLELAHSGAKLPAGITRHLIRWRALHVDLPLEHMVDTTRSLEQKNAWLHDWLEQKFQERRVRFYEESTVLFDE
jgi:hypothetical protein